MITGTNRSGLSSLVRSIVTNSMPLIGLIAWSVMTTSTAVILISRNAVAASVSMTKSRMPSPRRISEISPSI